MTGVKREGRRIFGREARVSLIKHARVPAAPYAAAGAKFHAARFAPWEEVHFVVVTRAACRTEAPPPCADAFLPPASGAKQPPCFRLHYLADLQPLIYQRRVLETQQLFGGMREVVLALSSYFPSTARVFFSLHSFAPLFRVNRLGGSVHWSAAQLHTLGFPRGRRLVFQSYL